MSSEYIVVMGTPMNGFTFHGPFESVEAAADWADTQTRPDWWIAPLQTDGTKG
jgi:hypothetical protein